MAGNSNIIIFENMKMNRSWISVPPELQQATGEETP